MLSAWPELRPHPDVLQVTSGPWAALRVRQSRDETFAPRALGKKEVKRGFLLLKETQRFGGKSIYLRLGKESSQLVAGVCPSSLPYRDRQDNLADIVTGEWDNIFVNVRVTEGLSA